MDNSSTSNIQVGSDVTTQFSESLTTTKGKWSNSAHVGQVIIVQFSVCILRFSNLVGNLIIPFRLPVGWAIDGLLIRCKFKFAFRKKKHTHNK